VKSDPASSFILALDIGGTKTAAACIDLDGKILGRKEEPTCQDGPEAGIDQIVNILQNLINSGNKNLDRALGLGIGIPAVLENNSDRVIWAPNIKGWRNIDLKSALEGRLEIPVFIEYDGHTAVLGEYWRGAGQNYHSVALLIIGTGIGGGFIMDGKLLRGQDRLAGAAGWFALTTEPDMEDRLGQSVGQWESLCAGPGIVHRAMKALSTNQESSLEPLSKKGKLTARTVFDHARSGDNLALQIVHDTAGILGLGVANVISLINPEIVILGGSIGRQTDLLLPRIQEVVLRWAQPASARSVRIVPAGLGSDAGLFGAAYSVFERTRS
jgi:glucokinase